MAPKPPSTLHCSPVTLNLFPAFPQELSTTTALDPVMPLATWPSLPTTPLLPLLPPFLLHRRRHLLHLAGSFPTVAGSTGVAPPECREEFPIARQFAQRLTHRRMATVQQMPAPRSILPSPTVQPTRSYIFQQEHIYLIVPS